MGMNGEFNFRGRNPVKIRCCQYLNNVVEQDHRRVKGRLRPMLGFKTFYNARRVIIGIELAQKIHKRQFAIPITLQSNPAVTWRHVTLFSGDPYSQWHGVIAPELNDYLDGPFGGRDVVSVGDAFGETFLYYSARNPATGMQQRKVAFAKRVVAYGLPILVGSGYYLDESP